MPKSTMSGEETYTALAELFHEAGREQRKIRGITLNHETVANIVRAADRISINVYMGLRDEKSMHLFGVPVSAKFNVKVAEVGVLFEETYEKFNLRRYLPIRPWWERLDTTIGVEV